MARFILLLSCVLSLNYKVQAQIIRSPGLLSRPLTEALLETPRGYIEASRTFSDGPWPYIDNTRAYEIPRNYLDIPLDALRSFPPRALEGSRIIEATRPYPQPIVSEPCVAPAVPNIARPPSTTIITDCTPSVCKNLADTINLMIVSNLLQNTKGSEDAALRLAAPLLKDILANPALTYPGPISNLVNPGQASLYAPNVAAPNFISPSIIPSNIYDNSPFPGGPRVIAPSPIASTVSPNAMPNNGALLNLLKMLGSAV